MQRWFTNRTVWALRLMAFVAVVAVVAVAGITASVSPATVTSANRNSTTTKTGIGAIPKSHRAYYQGSKYFAKLAANPYKAWTPPKPPWKFCYNDSYQGNSWRADAVNEIKKLVGAYEKAGMATGGLTVTNSNLNSSVQLSQLNNLVNEGCNVIITIPASPTSLCSGLQHAFEKRVLVITADSPAYCPYAINVAASEYHGGYVTGKWLAQALHGKGNVVLVAGIPTLSPDIARRKGVAAAFKPYPGLKVVGTVTGQWTPSVAKSAMLKFLATHPQQIDGVWQSALMSVAVIQAFQQTGRPLPRVNGYAGSCMFLAAWHQYHLNSFTLLQGGASELYEVFQVAARMLAGQKPVVSTILHPVPQAGNRELGKLYKSSMTTQSTCNAYPADGRAVPDSYFNALFKGGKTIAPALKP